MPEAGGATERPLRLFFALWPPSEVATCLHRLAAGMEGRPMRRDGLHVTVAFLGPQLPSRIPALCEIAARTPLPRETLRFERLQYWSKQLVVAVADAVPPPLLDAVLRLHAELLALAIRFEPHGWTPHVTLLRKAPAQQLPAFEPCVWQPEALHLVASDGDGHYRILHSWPTL